MWLLLLCVINSTILHTPYGFISSITGRHHIRFDDVASFADLCLAVNSLRRPHVVVPARSLSLLHVC